MTTEYSIYREEIRIVGRFGHAVLMGYMLRATFDLHSSNTDWVCTL